MSHVQSSDWSLSLLGPWQLFFDEQAVHVSRRQQRLIAALALLPCMPRHLLAYTLWPESTEVQASGNLRSALWRVAHELPGLLSPSGETLQLDAEVSVDVIVLRQSVDRVIHHEWGDETIMLPLLRHAELLPGWYEDWIIFEQEHLQALRRFALEELCRHFLAKNEHMNALDAALLAVEIQPLSEVAHGLLVQAQLGLGNRVAAIRHAESFRVALRRELGIDPPRWFNELLLEL